MYFYPKSRIKVAIFFLISFSASLLWGLQKTAGHQSSDDGKPDQKATRQISITAAHRGNPYVNFKDGHDLDLGDNASATQPVALVSADFDSDGFADVVTSDAGGALQFLKGKDPANFAFDPMRKEQEIQEPFTARATGSSLGISPDFLFAGDYNADGKQDILGAAKGANSIVVVAGDGFGHFSQATLLSIGGNITAIGSGEIGKPDGQADIAIAYSNKDGSFIAVYEHPESAFKHAPEVIKLPSAATAITVGNTDEDFYSDIAVACGNDLVIVHERGQAYPWDMVKDSGITRPPAVVDIRRMPFSVASMTIGRFGDKRGTSLAMLGVNGNIYRIEPTRKTGSSNIAIPASKLSNGSSLPFAPTGTDTSKYAMLDQKGHYSGQIIDEAGNPLVDANGMTNDGREEYLKKRSEDAAKNAKQYSPEEISRIKADRMIKRAEMDVRQKEAFIKTISAKTSRANDWQIETIAAGSQFVSAANGDAELTRLNVSDSSLDDLMVTAKGSGAIQFVSRQRNDNGSLRGEVSSISAVSGVLTVVPMRLNLDGLDDLVVLRGGATSPSIVTTAPSSVFVVNTTDDNSVCQTYPDPCSLRGAIIEANANPGNNIIAFALPFGTVISPQSPLPSINKTMSLQSGHLPDGTRGVEISGANAGTSVDGLKIRASNVFVSNLAVNGFKSTIINGGPVGGNGIVIASDSGAPNIGNNSIWECFLGTDATGNIDRGNDATGLLIFDSDNNAVTGSLLSGNGGTITGGYGIGVTDGNSNSFTNNIIGLNAAGNAKLGNSVGILLTGANNSIGNDLPGQGNTISGNGATDPNLPGQCSLASYYFASGISTATLVNLSTGAFLTQNNTITGNFIGTNPGGTLPLGNCYGAINTSPLHQTTIGSITESGRNIVSDNGFNAIACAEEYLYSVEGGYCAIAGNNIGTDVSGNIAMPNNDRNYEGGIDRARGTVDLFYSAAVSYFGAPGGTSSGQCTGFCNLYSSNNPGVEEGIYFTGGGTAGFFNNYIGTNAQGNQPMGNTSGIDIGSTSAAIYVGGVGTDSGGAPVSLGNVISGNTNRALGAFTSGSAGYSSTLTIQGNRIGTDASGILAIPNGNNGYPGNEQPAVAIIRGFTEPTLIGGSDPLARNIISGNAGDGIFIFSGLNSGIFNNLIGVNSSLAPLGNGGNGIAVRSNFMQIGGDGALANHIAHNGTNNAAIHAGVAVLGGGSEPAIGVTIRGNSIHDNNGLAIDLGVRDPRPGFNQFLPDGVTINDYCSMDNDSGPNFLQNFPELGSPTYESDGTVTIPGFIKSYPHGSFSIDLYSNSSADPGSHGEGQTLIGTVDVSTNGNGFAPFTFHSSAPVSPGSSISAIATDGLGNTSEFSCNAGLCAFSDLAPEGDVCPGDLVVDMEGDQPDQTYADGVCDIDTSNAEPHECTLRAALNIVMNPNNVQFRKIDFDIPGPGVHMITTTGLPAVTKYVNIDGESQPGYIDKPLIEIRGTGATAGTGLLIQTTGATVKGLALNNFFDHAIHIEGGSSNRIQSCFIGIAADGTTPGPDLPSSTGIYIQNSHDNTIGGSGSGARNVVSHLFYGIYVSGGRQNFLLNNYVGTDYTGQLPRGNATGILILGSNDNWIGKKIDVDGNLISGNALGVQINSNSSHTIIQGNYIGTDSTGMNAIGNLSYGILVEGGAKDTQIGSGLGYIARNVIGGQASTETSSGILFNADAGVNNAINANYIGVNKDASGTISNKFGVVAFADEQTIGGGNGFPNVIGGNTDSGILVTTPAASPNASIDKTKIIGNSIGTNSNGTATNLGNGKYGIGMFGNVKASTVRLNVVGNNPVGIYVGATIDSVGPSENKFEKNDIGLSPSGSSQTTIPNAAGIILKGASNNTLTENTVSANSVFGVVLGAVVDDAVNQPPLGVNLETSQNKLIDNRIGTDFPGLTAFPNGKIGLVVGDFANNNCIGSCTGVGVTGGYGNVISGHDSPLGIGILLGSLSTTAPPANWPSGNQFRDNIVGMNRDLSGCLPNRVGMLVTKAGGNQIGVRVGGFKHGNVFTCNQVQGVSVDGETNGETIIQSNWIGVTPTGQNFPNNTSGGIGIYYTTETRKVWIKDTVIGGQKYGVYAVQRDNNRSARQLGPVLPPPIVQVTESLIGVFRDETNTLIPIANEVGIFAEDASRVLIGKLTADLTPKNIVSSNTEDGIRIVGGGDNQITDTIVGTDEVGSPGLGNGNAGVSITDSVGNILGPMDESTAIAAIQNIFSGNAGPGVSIAGSQSTDNKILGAKIGIVRRNGLNVRLPNAIGVAVQEATNTIIGSGFNDVFKNCISGNTGPGVKLVNTVSNYIRANFIGTDEFGTQGLGNDGDGVLMSESSTGNQVGDPSPDSGNTIAFNGGAGVNIDETAGPGNMVDPNIIYSNSGLGIDLGEPGHNVNDPGDDDEGPNRLQNYPEISNYGVNANGELIVSYRVDSDPANSDYGGAGLYCEFFIADASGEGETYLAYDYYSISDHAGPAGGEKTINLGLASDRGWTVGDLMTTSVTDGGNNTSEFFPIAPEPTPTATATNTASNTPTVTPTSTATATSTPTDSPTNTPTPTPTVSAAISGTVTSGNAVGSPVQRFVPNVLLSGAGSVPVSALTNALGVYSLSGFGAGAYTITASKAGGTNAAISSFDAARVAQHAVGSPFPQLSGNQLLVADVSGNGEISSFDAAQIASFVVSNPPFGIAGTWRFTPASNFHASVNSNITGEDYMALLLGDVSGNWDDPNSLPAGRLTMLGGPERSISVALPGLVKPINKELVMPIRVDGVADKGIIAYEFDLRYDPLAMQPQTNPVDLTGTISNDLTAVTNLREPGLLRVAIYGAIPINRNGILLNLRFMAVGSRNSMSPMIFERLIFNEGYPWKIADG